MSGTVAVSDDDDFNSITANAINGSPNQPLTNVTVASFTDTNTVTTPNELVATIVWGDGTGSAGTIMGGGGNFTVQGTHTYTQPGQDILTVEVADAPADGQGTASTEASSTATIGLVAGTATSFNTPEGTPITGQVATFTDGNLSDTAGSFTATIDWGDGTMTSGIVSGGNGSISNAPVLLLRNFATTNNSNIAAAFGSNATYFGLGAVGGEGTSTVSSAQTITDTASLTVALSQITNPGNLVLGFYGGTQAGSGFTNLSLTVTANNATVLTKTFASVAALNGYFINDGVTLGSLASDGPTLNLGFSLSMTTNLASSGYDFAFLAGATAGSSPPPPPPPPPAVPAGTTADMIMRDGNNGNYEIYDLGNNAILAAAPLGQVGTEWKVSGVGGFFGTDTSDMILRNSNTGQFEIYDISYNTLTGAAPMGQVGLEWSVAGFGDFSSRSGETDMLMRDSNTGQFEIYDLAHNAITFAAPMGQVGLEWSLAGFGDFSTRPN